MSRDEQRGAGTHVCTATSLNPEVSQNYLTAPGLQRDALKCLAKEKERRGGCAGAVVRSGESEG